MKLLLKDTQIISTGYDFIFGIYDEPNLEKWGLYSAPNEFGHLCFIDNGFTVAEVDSLPTDYTDGKYLYINGTFALNHDYVEPLPPIEDRVTEVESDIVSLTDSLMNTDLTAVEMYEELLEQSEINMAQDETLIEMYEMLNM